MQPYHVLLATVSFVVVCWYVVGMLLFVPARASLTLSSDDLALLTIATWVLFAATLFANVAWALHLQMTSTQPRLSDGAWRTDVLLRLSFAIALFSLIVTVFFTDSDSDLFEWDFADRRLLTPLTPFEALFCPVVLAPLYLFLVLFAAIGRTQGNVIKLRSL